MSGYEPQRRDPRLQPPVTPPQWQRQQQPPRYPQPDDYAPLFPESQRVPPNAPLHVQQHAYAPPPRRNRPRWPIGAAAGIVVLALAGGAFYVTHNRTAAAPLTCAQQYTAWKTGPARAPGKQLEAAAASVSADGKTEDIPAMTDGLKTLGADAAALEAYPMPKCADPAGYWGQYLGQMKAAGDNAGTASGLGGLILAEAPLKQVPAIQAKLTAELARTAGVKAS